MTIKEAILALNANVIIACERAGFEYATIKVVEDALDTIEDALKAQRAIRPGIGIIHNDDGSQSYFLHCPIDGTTLDKGDRYCRKCGREVKWDG